MKKGTKTMQEYIDHVRVLCDTLITIGKKLSEVVLATIGVYFLCFHPYQDSKLDWKSPPCVFLGYPTSLDGYLCLDPAFGKMYVSRDVKFIEANFSLNKSLFEDESSHYIFDASESRSFIV